MMKMRLKKCVEEGNIEELRKLLEQSSNPEELVNKKFRLNKVGLYQKYHLKSLFRVWCSILKHGNSKEFRSLLRTFCDLKLQGNVSQQEARIGKQILGGKLGLMGDKDWLVNLLCDRLDAQILCLINKTE